MWHVMSLREEESDEQKVGGVRECFTYIPELMIPVNFHLNNIFLFNIFSQLTDQSDCKSFYVFFSGIFLPLGQFIHFF